MIIGVLKEQSPENRVSLLPETCSALIKLKATLIIEQGAGNGVGITDNDYSHTGATIRPREEVLAESDILLSIHPLSDMDLLNTGDETTWIGIAQPLFNFDYIQRCADKGLRVFSLDMMPRTSRAQAMDVLSSQASIAGYKAVILAAAVYPRYFPMLTTSAGSVPPAKVLILGAGVAGLQAVATAKRLGAVVEVFDTRPAAKEEVLSLGAKFVEVEGAADASKAGGYAVEQTEDYRQKQKAKIAESIAKADVVITTAQIPGKTAPVLITRDMVEAMKPGSVIVDLAASTGGNCALTKNDETIHHHRVTIIGHSNLAASVPSDASKLYGKNVLNFLKLIIDAEGNPNFNFEDDLIRGTCMTHEGKIMNERVLEKINEMQPEETL